MQSYREVLAEDRRLCILRLLEESPAYEANDSTLNTLLRRLGNAVSRDALRTELQWLQEQGVLSIDQLAEHLWIARITERGLDVARGLAVVHGIKRPNPRTLG